MNSLIERMEDLLATLPLTESVVEAPTDLLVLRYQLAEALLASAELAETALPPFNHPEYAQHVDAIKAATSPKEMAIRHQRAGMLASEHGQHARAEHHFKASTAAREMHARHTAAAPEKPAETGFKPFKSNRKVVGRISAPTV